jgi:hypothetical protein
MDHWSGEGTSGAGVSACAAQWPALSEPSSPDARPASLLPGKCRYTSSSLLSPENVKKKRSPCCVLADFRV